MGWWLKHPIVPNDADMPTEVPDRGKVVERVQDESRSSFTREWKEGSGLRVWRMRACGFYGGSVDLPWGSLCRFWRCNLNSWCQVLGVFVGFGVWRSSWFDKTYNAASLRISRSLMISRSFGGIVPGCIGFISFIWLRISFLRIGVLWLFWRYGIELHNTVNFPWRSLWVRSLRIFLLFLETKFSFTIIFRDDWIGIWLDWSLDLHHAILRY